MSLNRFEKKKNAALAIESFAALKAHSLLKDLRLVLAGKLAFLLICGHHFKHQSGGYDPRLQDNIQTLDSLLELARSHSLTYTIETPAVSTVPVPEHTKHHIPDILFLLNFTTPQRTALLNAPSTKGLLYTPTNEHFGIGPVEAMACGLPILACNSGGPTESILDGPADDRTGWLRLPDPTIWAETLQEILDLLPHEKEALSRRSKERAQELFSLDAMSKGLEGALLLVVSLGNVDNFSFKLFALVISFIVAYVSAHLVFL